LGSIVHDTLDDLAEEDDSLVEISRDLEVVAAEYAVMDAHGYWIAVASVHAVAAPYKTIDDCRVALDYVLF
jgi:hypothetical protein